MKVKKVILAAGAVALLSLSSCGFGPAKYFQPSAAEWGSTYYHLRGHQGYNDPFSSVPVNIGTAENPQWREKFAVTNVKALVVPVDFSDYPADDPDTPDVDEEASLKEDLNKAVFGEPEDTRWHSLASYYKETSYGQCNVTGEVVDTFHLGIDVKEFANGHSFGFEHATTPAGFRGASSTAATKNLTNAIQSIYDEGGSREGEIDLEDYDANGDGYIDSIILIYTAPYHVRKNGAPVDDDLYWAFRWSSGGISTTDNPAADSFFWSSYETFFEGPAGEGLDAHTLIHEFGHILSLPDYYNYDYNGEDASGGIDMMDHNIGDHNSLSKAWLGWTTPYILDGPGTITLDSTTDTGNFIIIPQAGKWYDYDDPTKRWDGTLLSQFIMIEFITPTGVAKADGERPYTDGWVTYFNIPAVRIWHVDARIGQYIYTGGSYKFSGYTIATKYSGSGQGYCKLATSNTSSEMAFKDNPLLTLLSSEGTYWKYRGTASNKDLFVQGDTLKNYKFFDDSGEQTIDIGYDIIIKKINGNESATIQFVR